MPGAYIRFFEELNDFIPEEKRQIRFTTLFFKGETVKSIIENLGIPHTEVDMITVNDESVSFDYQPSDGDLIHVYPVFETFTIRPVSKVRPEPLRELRFILDVHLGKLSRLLRMTGFDAVWEAPFNDDVLAERSVTGHGILLTRDRGLLKRKIITHGYCIRSIIPAEQLREVIKRFDLKDSIKPFTRCMTCNSVLINKKKEDIIERLPPEVRTLRTFSECPACGRLYWEGTHWKHMRTVFGELLKLYGGPTGNK